MVGTDCTGCEATGVAAAAPVFTSGVASLALLNMAACLDESARVSNDIGQPHFVMNMGPGAAAGGPEFSHRRAFGEFSADANQNR